MMEDERVCCMCGDVGFPDKIFRCIKCQHRFQHSYVSPYLCLLHTQLWCIYIYRGHLTVL
ncbi:hypothetical protein HanLR1_Chr13g0505151 [Helianthus annuus]|nr:hypothetical protein HanLR1_Chr13g0505151 [Helianthus annuus]